MNFKRGEADEVRKMKPLLPHPFEWTGPFSASLKHGYHDVPEIPSLSEYGVFDIHNITVFENDDGSLTAFRNDRMPAPDGAEFPKLRLTKEGK